MNVVFLSYKSFVNDLFLSKWRDRTFFKSIIFTLFSVLLCINFISEGVFKNAEDTRILFLMIVSLCIWSGIFNSISDISKMKDILSDDFERGISVFGFILAESFIQLLLCFIETIIVSVAIFFNYEFPDVQMIIDIKNIDYFVTVFLIFVAADFMGIMFSAMSVFVSSNNPFSFTMTIIPLLLLVQLLLSNVLVELKGSIALFVSHFSICKWGCICTRKNS